MDNVIKLNNNKYPNDFCQFDITFCVSIIRNTFPNINPENGWSNNDYSKINLTNFNEADAFNYTRIIRNEFYGHTVGFQIEDNIFDDLIEKLDKVFEKLNIDNSLIKLKNEILTNEITNETEFEDFQRWKQETTKLEREYQKVKFEHVKQIEPVNLTIDTNFIILTSFYIQQSLEDNKTSYLIFKIDE